MAAKNNWYFNWIPLPNPSDNKFSELLILQATAAHSGNYTCFPSNAAPASTFVHIFYGKLMIKHFYFANYSALQIKFDFYLWFKSGENPFGLVAYGCAGESTTNPNYTSLHLKMFLLLFATTYQFFFSVNVLSWHQ